MEDLADKDLNKEATKKKFENMNQAEYLMDLVERVSKESKEKQEEYES